MGRLNSRSVQWRSNFCSGLDQWQGKLKEIKADSKKAGIEKMARVLLYFVRIVCLSELISWAVVGRPKHNDDDQRRDLTLIDCYVAGKTLFLLVLVILPDHWLSILVASYLLAELYVAILNIVLIGTATPDERPLSIPRSLILAILNVLQITLTFALYYRATLNLDPGPAIAGSFQVFGTVGTPIPPETKDGSYVVALQLALDFVFIVLFLGALVSQINSDSKGAPR
jgi:hypothetical protein